MFSKMSKPKSSKSNNLQVINEEEQIVANQNNNQNAFVRNAPFVESDRTVTEPNESFFSFEKIMTQQQNDKILKPV